MTRNQTWVARMTASRWRKRVKELVRLKGPVSHLPAATNSIPPPPSPANWARCATAAWNAFVLEVVPSPTPPKSFSDAVWARCLTAPPLMALPGLRPWWWTPRQAHSTVPMDAAINAMHNARVWKRWEVYEWENKNRETGEKYLEEKVKYGFCFSSFFLEDRGQKMELF